MSTFFVANAIFYFILIDIASLNIMKFTNTYKTFLTQTINGFSTKTMGHINPLPPYKLMLNKISCPILSNTLLPIVIQFLKLSYKSAFSYFFTGLYRAARCITVNRFYCLKSCVIDVCVIMYYLHANWRRPLQTIAVTSHDFCLAMYVNKLVSSLHIWPLVSIPE